MKRVAVIYATREGQTQRIAEAVSAGLIKRGLGAVMLDTGGMREDMDPAEYSAFILAASVHIADHEPEMIDFVKRHHSMLETRPNAFLSVTLSEAGAERKDASAEEHARFAADVQTMIDRFVAETGWHPQHVLPVAGALRYSKYNFPVRILMKRIARAAGGSTDVTRDHEYTDWVALDEFVARFAQEMSPSGQGRS